MLSQKLTTFAALAFFASNSALAAPMPLVPALPSLPSLPSITAPLPIVGGAVDQVVKVAGGVAGGPLSNVAPVVAGVPVLNSVIGRSDSLSTVESAIPSVTVSTVDPSKLVGGVSAAVVPNVVNDVVRRTDNVAAAVAVPIAPLPSLPALSSLPISLPSLPSLPIPSLPVAVPNVPVTVPNVPVTVPNVPVTAPNVAVSRDLNNLGGVVGGAVGSVPLAGSVVPNVLPTVGGLPIAGSVLPNVLPTVGDALTLV